MKWQVKVGDSYQDYTQTSVLPTTDMTFRAVYKYVDYSIAYVADGATHNNPASYTTETPVTFENATKEGYFFGGWYTDSVFTQRIESTAGLTEELTVYAQFVKDIDNASATIVASDEKQVVPMPALPAGFVCTTKLCEKGATDALELENGAYYAFSEVGKVYIVEYTITLPTGESVVRTLELTVVQETQDDVEPAPQKDTTWLLIGLIGGGVLLVGAGVGAFFYIKRKKKEND